MDNAQQQIDELKQKVAELEARLQRVERRVMPEFSPPIPGTFTAMVMSRKGAPEAVATPPHKLSDTRFTGEELTEIETFDIK